MVIYGWRSSHIVTHDAKNITCPSCGEKGGIVNIFHGKYFHFFWIPTFSLGKKGTAHCTKCDDTFSSKKMPENIDRQYREMKSEVRIPLWHFSGIAILALFIAFIAYSSKVEAKNELAYITNPLAGDVYEYQEEPENFSTLKVVEVTKDSILYLINNYAFTTKNGIEKIEIDSCYGKDLYIMSRTELKNMFNKGTIYDVNRK